MVDVAETIAGDWIGSYALAGTATVISVRWTSGSNPSGSLDLLGALTFRRPLTDSQIDADRLCFSMPSEHGPLSFNGRVAGDRIAGTVHQQEEQGAFDLRRVVRQSLPHLRSCAGTYQVAGGEVVLIGLNGDEPGKFPFYARGDRLIPLYPLSSGTLFSELGETLDVVRGETGKVTGLQWRRADGVETVAPRIELYQEAEVRFDSGAVTLAGTMLTPFGEGPHPAVALMHGTMPGERDFYRVYADRFARRGIAALIYDKRGFGASTGNADSSIADRAEDALSALRFMQTARTINPRAAGLWGFSNATWSLPFAAARSDAVAFLIATGAAGVSMARAEIHRRVAELREWGLPDETLRGVARAWSICFEYAVTGRWNDAWETEWNTLVERLQGDEPLQSVPLQDYVRANPLLSPIPPPMTAAALKAAYGGVRPEMGYDPVTDYERVRCPVLFLIGENDRNLPAREGATRVAEALKRAGNRDYTVNVLPNVEHALNVSYPRLQGMTTEEASMTLHGFRFAPGYLSLMCNWVLERFGTAARATP